MPRKSSALDSSTESNKSQLGANSSAMSSRVADTKRASVRLSINEARNHPPCLAIMPAVPNATSIPTSSAAGSSKTKPSEKNSKVFCSSCKNYTNNPKWCPTCNINLPASQFSSESDVMPKMSVSKQIIFNPMSNSELGNQSQGFHFQQSTRRKIFIKTGTMLQSPSPRARCKFEEPDVSTESNKSQLGANSSAMSSRAAASKRAPVVPVMNEAGALVVKKKCTKGNSPSTEQGGKIMLFPATCVFHDDPFNEQQLFRSLKNHPPCLPIMPVVPNAASIPTSGAAGSSKTDNKESDDPQFPGVTDLHPKQREDEIDFENEDKQNVELEEEKLIDEEEDEDVILVDDEDIPPEEGTSTLASVLMPNFGTVEEPLLCRSVIIGSFIVHPQHHNKHIPVTLTIESISFQVPTVTDSNTMVLIAIHREDIQCLYFHFGRRLPILFLNTTPEFAENIRKALNMVDGNTAYFDPASNDIKEQKLIFVVERMSDEHHKFFRFRFPGEARVKELDYEAANSILTNYSPDWKHRKGKI